jgi:hypothetical protein
VYSIYEILFLMIKEYGMLALRIDLRVVKLGERF